MAHPVYLPSASIHPGNTSYRAVTPEVDDAINDDSSDLSLDDFAYARKIRAEIGLDDLNNPNKQPPDPLLHRGAPGEDERSLQMKATDFLSEKLATLTAANRFRATNLYNPPIPTRNPTVSAFPLTGPSMPPPPPPPPSSSNQVSGATLSQHWALHSSRHYTLPAEPPMQSVPVMAPGRAEAALRRALEEDAPLADIARQRQSVSGDRMSISISGTARNSVATVHPSHI